MEEKFCNGCQKSKLIDEFWTKHGKPQARCKECQKDYHKQHYKDNMKAYKTRAYKRNKQVTLEIREYIRREKDKPCQDCGFSYPYYVMDFDHRPGEKKLCDIARMAGSKVKLEKVKKEIAKCDIVCSNCHRIRTHNRNKTA